MWLKSLKKTSEQKSTDVVYSSVWEAIKAGSLGSVMSAGSLSKGDYRCTTGIKIDSRHFGDLVVEGARNAVCWLSPASVVSGHIVAPAVYVEGSVSGNIYADRVVIKPGGVVDGDVFAVEVLCSPAGVLRGNTITTIPLEYRARAADVLKKLTR